MNLLPVQASLYSSHLPRLPSWAQLEMGDPAAQDRRDLAPFSPIVSGNLMVKIAQTEQEIGLAQHLRYQIFCGEIGARATPQMLAEERDFDDFDPWCDHLLVLHRRNDGEPEIVGTYRLLREDRARKLGRFYSEGEYDIDVLKALPQNIMELGRSCVHADFRVRPVLQLLWRGIGAYVTHHQVDLMFGCASFPGAEPETHALGLSYLHHFHQAKDGRCPRALPHLYTEMDRIPKAAINPKRGFHSLPPLLKGYLRLGGAIGDGAVLDREYNTTDVCIVVQTGQLTGKYAAKFAPGIPA